MTTLSLDGFVPLHGGEPISRDGEVLGFVSSAGYGHRLERTIALGYLPTDLDGEATFDIEAFGHSYPASRGSRCLYDPGMQRLKA